MCGGAVDLLLSGLVYLRRDISSSLQQHRQRCSGRWWTPVVEGGGFLMWAVDSGSSTNRVARETGENGKGEIDLA
ncbi:Hypothetical predicted protein [Olea europaea subsp. europaea]|uniref:Uncharacterized protein n=1 Tax=Olea europaea subsp. europaea TaxID=158383 RepID=A0A8S0TTU2_OLEEU|nr:Hypothetical predicted protein [Olea europaea subsp. europaea]